MRFPTPARPADPAAPVTVTAGELAGWAFDTGLVAHYLTTTATPPAAATGRAASRTAAEILTRLTSRFTDLATAAGPAETTRTAP
jgi:hypothetical protein